MQQRPISLSFSSFLLMACAMALLAGGCDEQQAATNESALAHATQAAFNSDRGSDDAADPADDAKAHALKVIFLGDSLTAGLGLPQSDAFPAVIERSLHEAGYDHVRCINAGVSGDTSAGGLSRIDWLLKQDPAVVVIGLGANDGMRGQSVADIQANLRSLIQTVHASGAQPLLLGMHIPTNLGPDYTADFHAIYTSLADEMNVPLVANFLEGVGGVRTMNQPDGIHPTAKGHQVLADNVEPALLDLIREQLAAADAAQNSQ